MKETTTNLEETEDLWKRLEEAGEYLKLENGRTYQLRIRDPVPYEDSKYPDPQGRPKFKVRMKVVELDGACCDLEWSTGSYPVIRAIRDVAKKNQLETTIFILTRQDKAGAIRYTVQTISSQRKEEKVGAFM